MRIITNRLVILAAGLMFVGAASANGEPLRGIATARVEVIRRPFFYDPFWGPWHPYPYV